MISLQKLSPFKKVQAETLIFYTLFKNSIPGLDLAYDFRYLLMYSRFFGLLKIQFSNFG